MNNTISTLIQLGERLASFGTDATSRGVIDRARAANGWFREAEICRAVEAIRTQMLAPKALREWLAAYPALPVAAPRRVLVVMAGNIPLVGFFDLLCVVASGHCALLKPATKDRVLVEYVVDLLREIDPTILVALWDGVQTIDTVIATGSDVAVRHFRAQYAALPTLLRGTRHSVAVLTGDESEAQRAALADDIFAYSGLGCRNVSMIFMPEGVELRLSVPPMSKKYANNYRQTRALLTMQGLPYNDFGGAVAVEQGDLSGALSCLSIVRYRSLEEVDAWLAAHNADIQCVVGECINHPRRVGFGCAQSPALTDYPDAIDVVAWLAALK